MKTNIWYKSDELSRFYTKHRCRWKDFYPSERWIFRRIGGKRKYIGRSLDVGCAAGGLAYALSEEFKVTEYFGIDINAQNIAMAERIHSEEKHNSFPKRFVHSDILDYTDLLEEYFDNVFSLSCADWNVRTEEIIYTCWKYVRPEGHFVLTLRLTTDASLRDISESYQYICFGENHGENIEDCEKAPYVIFNVREALSMLSNMTPKPDEIVTFGYWGKPSPSARIRYDDIVFAALAVKKGKGEGSKTMLECHWPVDLLL